MDSSKKFLITAVSVAIVLIILVSFTLAYSGRDNTLMSDKTLSFEVNGFNVEVPLSQNDAAYDVVSLSTGSVNKIKLNNEVGATVKIDEKEIASGATMDLKLSELSAGKQIKVQVENEKDKRVIYLRTLSSALPEMLSAGESSYDGNYYAALATGGAALYELNEKGEVVFYIAKDQEKAQGESYRDFKKHVLENGAVRYSYQRAFSDGSSIGYATGERVILDENYKEMKTIRLAESEYASEGDLVNGHDFILIDDKHYIVESSQLILIHNAPVDLQGGEMGSGSKVIRSLIQEIKDNKVIFEFATDSHPALYPLTVAGNDQTDQKFDVLGFNRMIIDPNDDGLMVSYGNRNTMMKIDRKTGEIVWKLSGDDDEFALTPEQKTSKQTDMVIDDKGFLTVFDTAVDTGVARIVRFKLDEANKEVLDYQEHKLPGATQQGGSVQKIGDNMDVYIVGCGQGQSGQITEIDFSSGRKIFEVHLPEGVFNDRVQKLK